MNISMVPIFSVAVLGFFAWLIVDAVQRQSVNRHQADSLYLLLGLLVFWTLISSLMGLGQIHTSPTLQAAIPLLWQACVPVAIAMTLLLISRNLRTAITTLATHTPAHRLILFQILRIGAIGGILKGASGAITSGYVFWVGIPDLIYGMSAVVIGGLAMRKRINRRLQLAWHLTGPAIILLPTFIFMPYWMNEPGFIFIFEFPMVLAPSIVVPLLIFANLLGAWALWRRRPVGTAKLRART